ncbi:hypothetical protein BT96DRAFT_885839 [Gymnopus androsaceus JB14]|uniref:DUF6533 domain-containing protein n=1 Tax=Gymnopus androsaceus JB14 TaxID=1447944 RepID=A0A6A4HAV1_9AGAR|nr:hypothetical protein BT96DRAFT_885839 [Gymnopus androsaceus JB14]
MIGVSQLSKYEAAALYPDETSDIVETVAVGLWLVHVLQVYTSCMVTLAVWDWLACLPAELERVWRREWSLVKFLYLWNRYYGLLCFSLNLWLFNGDFTVNACKSLHYIIAATCMWVTLGSEAILAIRTYAFLSKQRSIGIPLVLLLLGETAYLLYVAIAGVHQTALVYGTVGLCTASDAPGKHIVMGFWLCPVVFDLICTGLTGMKAIQLKRLGVKSNIVKTFVREGLLYFVAIAVINVINAAFMFQSDANIQNINSFLALILTQVLCCRLILNFVLQSKEPRHRGAVSSIVMVMTPPTGQRTNTMRNGGFSIPLNTFQRSVGQGDAGCGLLSL